MSDPKLRALTEAALKIGRKRQGMLSAMRAALIRGDTEAVIRCARQLTGLDDPHEESDRVSPRFN